MTNKISVESTFLPLVEDGKNLISLDVVGNRLTIVGYDSFLKDIEDKIDMVASYDYQDEDKSTIKKLRSEINKFKDHLKSNFNANRDSFLNHYTEQQKTLFDRLDKLIKLLSVGIEEHENRLKAEKYKSLNEVFNNILKDEFIELYDEELAFTDVLNPKWTNLTAKEKDSISEMKDRLTTLSILFNNKDCPNKDVKFLVKQLDLNNYNGLLVLSKLQDAEKKRLEELEKDRLYKEAQMRKQSEKDESNNSNKEQNSVKSSVIVRFKESDWNKVKTILTASSIEFTVID